MSVDKGQKREGKLTTYHLPLSPLSRGFTLVEMLVVIVIVAILMGIVFKLSRGIMSRNESAKEVARVAILKALVEEFHAEYGIYPPVPEYDGVQPIEFTGPFPTDGSDLKYYVNRHNPHPFKFGLLSFFLDRGDFGGQTFKVAGRTGSPESRDDWEKYNDRIGDGGEIKVSDKDKAFVKRVKPILTRLEGNDSRFSAGTEFDAEGHTTGFDARVKDSWWRSYVYVSEPPYTSCLIFSMGPDGKYDKDHPADRTRPENKDNIYGDLGDK